MLEARVEILLDAKVISFRNRFAESNNDYLFAGEDHTGSIISARTFLRVVSRDKAVDWVIQVVSFAYFLMAAAHVYGF